MKLSSIATISDLLPHKKNRTEKMIADRMSRENKHMFQKNNIEEVLKKLKAAGVDGIELLVMTNTTDKDCEEIIRLMLKHKLRINSIHQSLSTFLFIRQSQIKRLFEISKLLSCDVIVLHIDAVGRRIKSKNFLQTIRELEELYNVRVGFENMPKTPFNIWRRYTWKHNHFSKTMLTQELGITLDTTHLAQARGDIMEFYRDHKKNIVNIHLSDYKKNWKNNHLMLTTDTHLPIGKGILPIQQLLKELKENKYKGLITMEIDTDLNGMCKSAAMIKKVFS